MEGHLPLLQMLEAQHHFYMAHKMEYLWETCAVNFIGARFVVQYCIKSNPGGSSRALCVCCTMHMCTAAGEHAFIYSFMVKCVGEEERGRFLLSSI